MRPYTEYKYGVQEPWALAPGLAERLFARVLRGPRTAEERPGPSASRLRRVALAIGAAIWDALSDSDAWTPAVDRVARHPEHWFRIV